MLILVHFCIFFHALISILSVTQCKKEADIGWLVILEKDTCTTILVFAVKAESLL